MAEFSSKSLAERELVSAWNEWATKPCTGVVILAGSCAGECKIWLDPAPIPAWSDLVPSGAFLWEALLYATDQFSISIRHVDGRWRVNRADWGGCEPCSQLVSQNIDYHHTQTLGLNVPVDRPMQWVEVWLPKGGENIGTGGIPCLCKEHLAFTGFKSKEEQS